MLIFYDMMCWKSESVAATGYKLCNVAKRYKDSYDELLGINMSSLSGLFADAEMRSRRALADDADDLRRAFEKAGNDFSSVVKAMESLKNSANSLYYQITAGGGSITSGGTVYGVDHEYKIDLSSVMNSGQFLFDDISDPNEIFTVLVSTLGKKGEDLITFFCKIYDELAKTTTTAKGPRLSVINSAMKKPNKSWSVEEVNDWWTSKSTEEQEKIILKHPEWIGNADGIPSMVRHKANVLLLDKEIKETNAKIAQLENQENTRREGRSAGLGLRDAPRSGNGHGGHGHPKNEGPDADTLAVLYGRREELLAMAKAFPKPKPHNVAHFLKQESFGHSLIAFDPWKGGDKLRATVGVGDVDSADHILAHTPGMGNSVVGSIVTKDGGWGRGINEMENILKMSRNVLSDSGRNDEKVAGIYNLNYDSPELSETLDGEKSVLSDHRAKEGAEKASRLYDGLQATHDGDPHLVPSGHSYGSLLTGYAVAKTTAPDGFTAYGTPGFKADRNSHLNLLPGQVQVAGAEGDGVAASGWHKRDLNPNYNINFEHFSTEDWKNENGKQYYGSYGHSEYTDLLGGNKQRTSTYNIANILIGNDPPAPEK